MKAEKVWYKWDNGQVQRVYIYKTFTISNEKWFRGYMSKRSFVLKEKDYGIKWSKNKGDLL